MIHLYTTQKVKLFSIVLGTILLLLNTEGQAARRTWRPTTATGTWSTAANWLEGAVPVAADEVIIDPSVDVSITGVPSQSIDSLTIGATSGRSINLTGTSGTLTVGTITRLLAGNVTFTINALTITANGAATINASATLNIANGATFNSVGGVTGAGSILVFGTLNNNTTGTNSIQPSIVQVYKGGIYLHSRNGGAVTTATWNTGAMARFTGITNTTPSANINQAYFDFEWNCAQTSNIDLGIGSGFSTAGDFRILRTSSATNSANGINGNPSIGFALILFNGSTASDVSINIGDDFEVGTTGATTVNAFVVLSNGTGINNVTFNIADDMLLQGNNASGNGNTGAGLVIVAGAISARPCTLNVGDRFSQGSRTTFLLACPGTTANTVTELNVANELFVGEAGRTVANDVAFFHQLWFDATSTASANNQSTVKVGTLGNFGVLNILDNGTIHQLTGGTGNHGNNQLSLNVYGNINSNGTGAITNTPRISFGAVNTANASTAGNTLNVNVFKVAGNHGNIQINGTGGFHGFTNTTTPALLFGGTTTTVNLDIEGSFLLNNTLNAGVNLFSAGSGSGNAFNLTVDGDMLVRANLTFNGSIGNNAVFTGTCNNLTQTGAAFNFSAIGGTATGATTSFNTLNSVAFGGGNFNFQANTAPSTTNTPTFNIGGNLSVSGATVHFYPSTIDNLSANINITGGLRTSGGTITTSGSPMAIRRSSITFVGGGNHVWNGVVAGSRLALGSTIDFVVPATNTLQITNSQLINGNLLVDGSLEFPTSPAVTFTLNGNLTGTGNIKMNGAPHTLVLSGTGSQSIDSIYTNNSGSTVVYNSGSALNVIPLYYENLRFSGNGQKVISGEVIVTKDFNMVAGSATMGNTSSLFQVNGNTYLNSNSFSFGSAAAHNVIFNGLVNSGSISMPTSAFANNLTFGGEAYGVSLSVSNNTTGTVIYNALGKQNILAGTYANLTIDGSGLKNGNNGAITVNGKLTLKGSAFVAQLNGDITNRAANTALNLGVGAQIEVDGGTLSSAPRLAVSTSTYTVSYLRSAVSGAELRPVVGVLSGLNISGNTVVTLDSVVTIGAVAINGSINFGTDEGVLDLGAHDLTIFRTSAGTFFGTIGAANGKILTNGVGRLILMGGTTRANYNQTYPLATGIAGAYRYSPIVLNFTAVNISSGGLNLRAIGQRHPLSAANIANKYYEVRTTGIWTNVTGSITLGYTQSEVNGNQTNYVGQFLNTSNGSNWGVNSATLSNGGSTPNFTTSFNYTNSSNIAGTYTFGEATSFPSSILWSKTSGNWTTSGTFVSDGYLGSTNEVPTATSYVVIGNNRTVTANTNNLQVAGLLLEPTGTLELGYTEGHNFGKVSGNGTLSFVLDSVFSENPVFPLGDFSDFFSEQGNGSVAFGGVGTYSLPSGITTYNNINVFGGGTKQGPGSAFTIRRQLNLGVSGGANTAFSIANDIYFTGGGLNVINIANNFTGTINHITGTAFFNGNGNHTFNAGNTEQFFNMRGISVGTNAILVLRNGNTGNQFNLSGNITLNTTKGAGLVTDANFDGFNFNTSSTVSAPNGATLNLTSVAISAGATVTNTANWILTNDILNNGTLNCTAGTIFWGRNAANAQGLLYRTAGSPVNTFHNLEVATGNFSLTLAGTTTVSNTLTLNRNLGGTAQGVFLPANDANYTYNFNNVIINEGVIATSAPSTSSSLHTVNLSGNVQVLTNNGLNLFSQSGGFINRANVNVNGASAKSWLLANATQDVGTWNSLTFANGAGKVMVNGMGNLNLMGSLTMSSANEVNMTSTPNQNNTLRISLTPGAAATIGGTGVGLLVLPNLSVGGSGTNLTLGRNFTISGSQVSGTSAWNSRAFGIQAGLAVNPIVNFSSRTITFIGQGEIINASDAYSTWIEGSSTWIINPCGATNINNNVFFRNLILEGNLTCSANLFLRAVAFNPGDKIFTLGSNAELRVSGSTTTTNPAGVFGTNCSVEGGTFSEGGDGQTVFYTATVPQIITNRGYTGLNLSGGVKNLIGNTSSRSLFNTTYLNFGNTAVSFSTSYLGELSSATGTIDMSGAAHTLTIGSLNNTVGTLITSKSANSTIVYNSSLAANQIVFGSDNYRNLTFTGTGVKLLSGNVTVGNQLTLTSSNVFLANNNLTLGLNAAEIGTLARTSGNIVTNGTGAFIRWYGVSGLPNAVNSISGLYPFVSTSGQSRLVSLYFTNTTALNSAGSIGIRHSEANGIATAAFTDGVTNIQNRTLSGWIFTTPNSPFLSSGQSIALQVTAEGTCAPPDNTAAQDLRFTTSTAANGNHLSVATSTISIPVVARTGLVIANLTGSYHVSGSGTTLPNNIFTARATGNWNATATWEGNVVPPADAAVIIPAPFIVTLTANASCASLNLADGATLNAGLFQILLGAGRTTQINGTLNTANNNSKSLFGNAGSTFDVVTNSLPSSSTVVFSPTTSVVNYNGTGAQTIQGIQYRNLTISTASRTGNITFESGATTSVNGVFTTPVTFGSGFGFVTTGSTFRFNGADIQTYNGSINFDNVVLANTNNELRFNGTMGIAGVLTFTNNNLAGNHTVNFNGTGNQTIPSGNYQRLTIGGGARTVTLSPTGTVMITTAFTPSYDPALTYINTNSTVGYAFGLMVRNFEYFNLRIENSGAMTFDNTNAGPGAIKIAGTFQLPDNTPLITTGSTVEYNGTGAQTILGGITYHNLIVSGNRGTANMNLGGGLPVTVTGNFNISAATSGIWTVQPVTLSGSTAQTITGVPTFAFANLTLQGTGLKSLGSNVTISALSTLTLNGNIECGNFDFILGSTAGSVTLSNSPTGTIRTSGTGKLIRFFNNSTSIPVTTAPSNGNQHLNFPLATSAGTTRQVYFFSSAAQTPTTAGFISVRYIDGTNKQTAPNTVVVNGQTVSAISKGYWEVNSTVTFPNAFGMGINSYGMFNATNPSLLRPVIGANGTPSSISAPAGTWTGSGNFPSYNVVSTVSLSNADKNNKIYFLGSAEENLGNSFLANAVSGNYSDPATWLPNGIPDASAGVVIPTGTSVTLNGNYSADFLDVQPGGTFEMGANKLTLGNSVLHTLAGTISTTSDSLIGGTGGAFPNRLLSEFTVASGSTIIYAGNTTQRISALTYSNLQSTGSGQRVFANGQTITISGTFTPGNNTYVTTGSTVVYNASGTATIAPCNYHNLTRSGISSTVFGTTGANGNIIGVSGVLNLGAGALTSTNSTLEFNGAGSQTIPARTYNNLVVSQNRNNGNITLPASGTVAITGSFTNTATNVNFITTNSTFDYAGTGSQVIAPFGYNNLTNTGNGARTLSSTGVIRIAGTWSRGTGTYTLGTSTVEFNGTGAQTIGNGNYYNLTVSNTRGSNNITWTPGTYTILNDLAANATFTSGNHIMTGTTIDFAKSTGTANIPGLPYVNITNSGNGNRNLTGNISISGTFTRGSAGVYTTSTSTVNYNGTGAQTIASIAYNNLTISQSRGSANVTLNNANTISISGNLVLSASNVNYVLTGTTLQFIGAAQTNIPSFGTTYNNLTFSGSGEKSFAAAVTMANSSTLTLSGTADLNNTVNNVRVGTTSGTIARSGGSLRNAPLFPTSLNLSYFSGATTGPEVPTSATILNNVVISSGAGNNVILAASTTPTINGNVSLASGNLDINSASSLTVNGLLNSSGGFVKGGTSSNLIIGGNSGLNASIPFASGFELLNNLTVNRSGSASTLTLGSNLTVNTNVNFGSSSTCRINTGANTLTLSPSATITGETNAKYVQGNLATTRTINNNLTGETFGGMGVAISECNNCGMGDVQMIRRSGPGSFATGLGNQSINRVWRISPASQPTTPVNLTLSWLSADDNYVSPVGNINVFKSTDLGTTWNRVWCVPTAFTARTITLQTSSFSDWTIGDDNNPLPVTLGNFTGKRVASTNQLIWNTLSEINNKGFEIERSINGTDFQKVGFVEGNGTTNKAQNYIFTDLFGADAYYRLKQVDIDGKFEYSKTIFIGGTVSAINLSVYPNPTTEYVNLEGIEEGSIVTIYNLQGIVVLETTFNNQPINVKELSNGMYTLQVEGVSVKLLKK